MRGHPQSSRTTTVVTTAAVAVAATLVAITPTATTAQDVPIQRHSAPEHTYERSFTAIGGVREVPGGLLVLDRLERSLVAVSGDRVTPLGREGDGPAEYREPWTLLGLNPQVTLMFDAGPQRFLVVNDTEIVATSRWPLNTSVSPTAADATGRIYFDEAGRVETGSDGQIRDGLSTPIIRFDPATAAFDTLATMSVYDLEARWEASPVSRMFRPGPGGFAASGSIGLPMEHRTRGPSCPMVAWRSHAPAPSASTSSTRTAPFDVVPNSPPSGSR